MTQNKIGSKLCACIDPGPSHPCLCYLIVEGDNKLLRIVAVSSSGFLCEDKKGRVCGAGVTLQIAAEVRA